VSALRQRRRYDDAQRRHTGVSERCTAGDPKATGDRSCLLFPNLFEGSRVPDAFFVSTPDVALFRVYSVRV